MALLFLAFCCLLPWSSATLSPMRDCCIGVHIRFGLERDGGILSSLYNDPVNISGTQTFEMMSPEMSGFVPALIEALSLDMGFTYEIIYAPVYHLWWGTHGPVGVPYYDDPSVIGGTVDAYLNSMDTTIACGKAPSAGCLPDLYSAFTAPPLYPNGPTVMAASTVPIYTPKVAGLVKRSKKDISFFRFLTPFSGGVWLSIGLMLLVSAGIMHGLDRVSVAGSRDEKPKLSTWLSLVEAFYHALAASLGGDEREWLTWPARFVRIALLFCFLVLVSLYTANLAAFFVEPAIIIGGPADMTTLQKRSVACINNASPGAGMAEDFSQWASEVIGVTAELYETPLTHPQFNRQVWEDGRQFCREALQSGAADIWLSSGIEVHSEHLRSCQTTARATFLHIDEPPMVFTTSGDTRFGAELASNLTKALVPFQKTPANFALQAEHFNFGESCEGEEGLDDGGLEVITFAEIGGLYLMCAAVALVGITMAFVLECKRRRAVERGDGIDSFREMLDVPPRRSTAPSTGSAGGQEEMLKELLQMVRKLAATDTGHVAQASSV
jgi:hypothetical protein